MKLLDAEKAHAYKLKPGDAQTELPAPFRRRGLSYESIFTYAGKVGGHHILKFGGMRIAIHQALAQTLHVEALPHENRPRR